MFTNGQEVERLLEVVLTQEELVEKGKELSAAIIDRMRVKAKAKNTAEGFAAEVKLFDQQIEQLGMLVDEGKEFRKVKCVETITANGIEIETTRQDTGELVGTRAMSADERQVNIFDLSAEQAKVTESRQNIEGFFNIETETLIAEIDAAIAARAEEQGSVESNAVQDPCVCGHDYAQHFRDDVECEACDCSGFIERTVRCPECDLKDGHQASCSQYVTASGTPVETERMVTEIDDWAKQNAEEGKPVKRIMVDAAPYIVIATDETPSHRVSRVEAFPVLPVSTAGDDESLRKFNCGTKKKPDWWIVAGPLVTFTIRQTTPKQSAVLTPDKDDFTAPICAECHRIEGAHSDTCSKRSMMSPATYLAFAQAMKLKNPQSHARKMELTRERDEEVIAWIAAEQGKPDPEKGTLLNLEPEQKPKRRGKLQLVEERSYEAGL